jgi:ribosome-binding protein aMBF1 (putative translation factor)|tara:strand:+ start:317 stop:475 length:159 start_codon:yes stop_codon:yes gene_type:complete
MKCEICGNKINENFLGKLIGTYVKDKAGKQHTICFECQKKFPSKEQILENIK